MKRIALLSLMVFAPANVAAHGGPQLTTAQLLAETPVTLALAQPRSMPAPSIACVLPIASDRLAVHCPGN